MRSAPRVWTCLVISCTLPYGMHPASVGLPFELMCVTMRDVGPILFGCAYWFHVCYHERCIPVFGCASWFHACYHEEGACLLTVDHHHDEFAERRAHAVCDVAQVVTVVLRLSVPDHQGSSGQTLNPGSPLSVRGVHLVTVQVLVVPRFLTWENDVSIVESPW